jgi:ABC-type amino acid transport system permease subunit
LAYVIGVRELTRRGDIISQREFRPFALSMFVVIVSWPCTCTISRLTMQLDMWLAPGRQRAMRA